MKKKTDNELKSAAAHFRKLYPRIRVRCIMYAHDYTQGHIGLAFGLGKNPIRISIPIKDAQWLVTTINDAIGNPKAFKLAE